jgi:hypothetical protein
VSDDISERRREVRVRDSRVPPRYDVVGLDRLARDAHDACDEFADDLGLRSVASPRSTTPSPTSPTGRSMAVGCSTTTSHGRRLPGRARARVGRRVRASLAGQVGSSRQAT